MYLAEVETRAVQATEVPEVTSCTVKWDSWPASTISHHGQACCEIAREWMLANDFSQLGDAAALTGPRWLPKKYPWGPSPWPMHWCEAVGRKKLDCGAHQAISQELFTARGVQSRPAQFVQQFSEEATRHWGHKWGEDQVPAGWIDGDVIYHEGCAVTVEGDEIKLWDASAGWWIDPQQSGGYGALLSVRILDPSAEAPQTLSWGGRQLALNRWNTV
ncbi:MAG: hypothetical protein KY446_01165 [Proteobacteria bacterium]|nr:hypothetical protein [Pseudomonadota bacterium]